MAVWRRRTVGEGDGKRRKKRSEERERKRESSRGKGSESTKKKKPALLAHPRFHAVVPLSSFILLSCVMHGRASARLVQAASIICRFVRNELRNQEEPRPR